MEKEKIKQIIRLYKQEEIENMNYIFGKPLDNNIFTQFELEAVSKIDLFDRTQIEASKKHLENKKQEGIT